MAERIRRALPHVPAERIIVAPDCGLKYLPREVAFGKMKAMADGARDRARGAGVSFRTTHTGSLPRPDDLLDLMFAREGGEAVDEAALDEAIERATAYVIDRQKQAGVSVIGDGEMSKPSYATYIKHRLSGFGGEAGQYEFEDLEQFPGAKARVFGDTGRSRRSAPACTAPIEVIDMDAPREDAERLNRLAGGHETFMSAASPGRDRAVLPQPVLRQRRGVRVRARRRAAPRIRDHRRRRHHAAGRLPGPGDGPPRAVHRTCRSRSSASASA